MTTAMDRLDGIRVSDAMSDRIVDVPTHRTMTEVAALMVEKDISIDELQVGMQIAAVDSPWLRKSSLWLDRRIASTAEIDRLRAAGVGFEDRQDLPGHRSGRITTHYSAAELSRLIEAS